MKVYFRSLDREIELGHLTLVGSGGEGNIYLLADGRLAKIFNKDSMTTQKQSKVLALVSKNEALASIAHNYHLALPEHASLNPVDDSVVGFEMMDFGRKPTIAEVGFDLESLAYRSHNGRSLDDNRAIRLIYALNDALEGLHRERIVLGDLNPNNVLYDFEQSALCFIDLDSAVIEGHGSITFTPEYLDPQVEQKATDPTGCIRYTQCTDRFAAGLIAHEVFVGNSAYFLKSTTPESTRKNQNKQRRVTLLGEHAEPGFLAIHNVKLVKDKIHRHMLDRYSKLKSEAEHLYSHLVETLVLGRRRPLRSAPMGATNKSLKTKILTPDDVEVLRKALSKVKQRRIQRLQLRREPPRGDSQLFKSFAETFGFRLQDVDPLRGIE